MALIRRVRYADLKKGIRQLALEYLPNLASGRIEILSKDPMRFRIEGVEAELRLLAAGIELVVAGVSIGPVPYSRLRPVLYVAAKLLMPRKVDAEFRFSDAELRARFEASNFGGEVRFGEEEITLALSLKGLAKLATPLAAAQVDRALAEWTDGE